MPSSSPQMQGKSHSQGEKQECSQINEDPRVRARADTSPPSPHDPNTLCSEMPWGSRAQPFHTRHQQGAVSQSPALPSVGTSLTYLKFSHLSSPRRKCLSRYNCRLIIQPHDFCLAHSHCLSKSDMRSMLQGKAIRKQLVSVYRCPGQQRPM